MVCRTLSSVPAAGMTAARMLGRLLLATVAAVAVMLAPSCVSLLELDGYSSATTELCGVLDQCYGAAYLSACQSYVGDRLGNASEAEREAWLIYFADNNCLGSCVNARRCLDEQPLCAPQAALCGQTEHCCGFSQGLGDCGTAGCCLPDGLECTDDSQCCASPCLASSCDEGRSCQVCGGTPCKFAGQSCDAGFECCSRICDPRTGTCSDTVCLENGVECVENFQCCKQFCAIVGNAATGVCTDPICTFDGDPCVTPAECCYGHCVGLGDGLSVCSSGACRPDGIPCNSAEQCCSDHCDSDFGVCALLEPCGQVGEPCEDGADCCYPVCDLASAGGGKACACKPEDEICGEQFECCSGHCSDGGRCVGDGLCAAHEEPCSLLATPGDAEHCCSDNCGPDGICCRRAFCVRSVCKVGVPFERDCLDCPFCTISNTSESCPGAVCADPLYADCCCNGWTADCVARAETVCGHVCAATLPP